MDKKNYEPAAMIFPLPADLKEQYIKWSQSFQQAPSNGKARGSNEKQDLNPVFVPVYPAYPGFMPYPAAPGTCTRGGAAWPPGMNPFILFLILILLVIIFKKDQIVETIRKLLLVPGKKPAKS